MKRDSWTVTPLDLENIGEFNLLMKTWKSRRIYEEGLIGARNIRLGAQQKIIFNQVERAVRRVKGRGGQFVAVRNPKKPEQIFGLAVREGPIAHFVFVKRWFRCRGIARALLAGCTHATFWTEAAQPLFAKLKLERIDL